MYASQKKKKKPHLFLHSLTSIKIVIQNLQVSYHLTLTRSPEKAVAKNSGDQNDLLQPGCRGPLSTESLKLLQTLLQEFGQHGLSFKCRKVKKSLERKQHRDSECPVIGIVSSAEKGCRVK